MNAELCGLPNTSPREGHATVPSESKLKLSLSKHSWRLPLRVYFALDDKSDVKIQKIIFESISQYSSLVTMVADGEKDEEENPEKQNRITEIKEKNATIL